MFTGKNNGMTATEVTTEFPLKFETHSTGGIPALYCKPGQIPMFGKVIGPRDNLLLTP